MEGGSLYYVGLVTEEQQNEMLKTIEWQTLEQRRQQARLLMLINTIDGLEDINYIHYLIPGILLGREARRSIIPVDVRTSTYQYSFFSTATRRITRILWFILSPDMTLSLSFSLSLSLVNSCKRGFSFPFLVFSII